MRSCHNKPSATFHMLQITNNAYIALFIILTIFKVMSNWIIFNSFEMEEFVLQWESNHAIHFINFSFLFFININFLSNHFRLIANSCKLWHEEIVIVVDFLEADDVWLFFLNLIDYMFPALLELGSVLILRTLLC